MLAVLAAMAVVGFVFAPPGESKVRTIGGGSTSHLAHDQGAVAPITTPKTGAERTAQGPAGAKPVSPRTDRGGASKPSAVSGLDIPRAQAATKPGRPRAQQVSRREEQRAKPAAPSARKIGDDRPAASVAATARVPKGQAATALENELWGDAVDPDGDCKFERVPREDKVRIIVPGKPHILSAEIGQVNAPRVLRDIKGDFDVSVRVSGTSHPGGKATTALYSPYHGAGLLMWQDPENYVRLEIAADLQHGRPRPYVNFEYRKDGALAVSSGLKNGDGWNHLRLRRRGDEIVASFGPDGVRWTSFTPLTVKLNDRLKVGVAAINSASKPLAAELEALEVSERPPPARDPKSGGLKP